MIEPLLTKKERAALDETRLLAAMPVASDGHQYLLVDRQSGQGRVLASRPDSSDPSAQRLWDALHGNFPGELKPPVVVTPETQQQFAHHGLLTRGLRTRARAVDGHAIEVGIHGPDQRRQPDLARRRRHSQLRAAWRSILVRSSGYAFSAPLIFISLLFRPDAIRLDRKAIPSLLFSVAALLSVLASPGVHVRPHAARVVLRNRRFRTSCRLRIASLFEYHRKSHTCSRSPSFMRDFFCLQFSSPWRLEANSDPVAAPPYFLNIRHFGYQGFFGASAAVAVALVDRRLRTAGVLLAAAALFGIIMFGSRGALLRG